MQDRDGDGSVSFDEFLHYVGKLGMPNIAEGKVDPKHHEIPLQ